MGLRDQIDSASDLAHIDVHVPEWGGAVVRLREPDTNAIVELEAASDEWSVANGGRKPTNLVRTPMLLSLCLLDPATGERLYPKWQDLAKRNLVVLSRLLRSLNNVSHGGPTAGESGAVPSGASS